MDFGKQFARVRVEVRELFVKLSAPQKITIGLLTFLVAGGMVLAVVLTRGESWVSLGGGGDAKSLAAMKSLLDQHGIPYRDAPGARGGALEVPRDRAANARWLAAENGLAGGRDTNLNWLFDQGNPFTPPGRIDQMLHESRKRIVEDSIRWNRSIRDASIVVQKGPEPIYAGRAANSDSAAVVVALRPGVEGLTRTEAATIRNLVSGAFNIPPQNIQLTDDRLQRYRYDASGGVSEDDDRTRATVQTTVENLLGRIYRPSEFVVGVLADLSTRRTQLRSETYDPDKIASTPRTTSYENESAVRPAAAPAGAEFQPVGGGRLVFAPAAAPDETRSRDKKESTFETMFSKTVESTEVPAGEVKGLSVNVVLDRAAVRRVLQAEEFTRLTPARADAEKIQHEGQIVNFTVEGRVGTNNLDQAVEAYRRAQTEFLKEQLPMSGAKVNVAVAMFPRAEAPVEPASAGGTLGWAREHWGDVLLGAGVLAGLFVMYRMFQRTIPPPLDVPPLDETAPVEAGAGAAQDLSDPGKLVNALGRQSPEAASASQNVPFSFLEDTGVESLYAFLQNEHPQTIALVLSHAEPPKKAEVLSRFAPDRQFDIAKRIANLQQSSPEAIQQVESGLHKVVLLDRRTEGELLV